jgi:hypothetical protein
VQGLVPSLEAVPSVEHWICCRHLCANYKDVGHKGLALKDKLRTAAATYTEAEWTREMEELKSIAWTRTSTCPILTQVRGQGLGSIPSPSVI